MSEKKCFVLIFTIFIYIQLVSELKADFQNELDSSQLQNLIKSVGRKALLQHPRENSWKEKKMNFSSPCYEDIYHFAMGILRKEEWTLKMIDAASKIPSGILNGNRIDLGMYDECLAIKVKKTDSEIRGRHCMYDMQINLNVTSIYLNPSICVPATCDSRDVTHILNLIIFKMTDIGKIGINSISATCSSIDSPEWTPGGIAALTVLGAFLCFLLFCTFLDLLQRKMKIKNSFLQALTQFSICKSALQILNTKINPGSFPVLNGIRVLSIFWIVMGHTYQHQGTNSLQINNLDLYSWLTSWKHVYVTLAAFAVDSFLTLSGFLMGYIFLKEMSKGRKFNLFDYYLHRYIRLTPAVVALILIAKVVVPHLGSGPIWDEALQINNNCEEKWWPILIYLQNFIYTDVKTQCLGHLWYLAVDMQLFLISPIILYPLAKMRKISLAILGLSFLVSLIVPAVLIAIEKYSAILMGAGDNIDKVFTEYYIVPYTRAGPWIVGIFFGHITATKSVKINRVGMILGWFIAVVFFIFCTWGFITFSEKDYEYNDVWEAIYGSISRPMWAFGVAWIIFASINGYGGPVGKLLSLPIFVPLSRISYCLYLVHMLMQIVLTSSARTLHYFSDFQMFKAFLSDLAMAIVFAFFFSVFFESPILILEKMVFRRGKKTKTENSELNRDQCRKV